jgi:23S rRNA (cytosine1962-C5)-methyltransferase
MPKKQFSHRSRAQTFARAERAPALAQRALADDETPSLPAVHLKSGRREHLRGPIVYRKRVAGAEDARAGDLTVVYDAEKKILGYGYYNPRSEIAVRMLSFGEQPPDRECWRQKLVAAVRLRRELLSLDRETNAYRVIHAEGDGLSGLVVDRFGDCLSAEVFSLAMHQRAQAILAMLAPLCETRHTYVQPSPQFLSQEGYQPEPLASPEAPAEVEIHEFGARFRVKFAEGHKTGFFCDQRENRRRLAGFCEGKAVLDVCCYTGGFAIQASRLGKAADVTGVDLDEAPLKQARQNAALNQAKVKFVHADAFGYMRDMLANGRQYDVVVLDPPKLIRSRAEIAEGTRKHFDLNRLAVQLVRPGGLLLTCSCAGLLSEEDFLRLVFAAARQTPSRAGESEPGRLVQLLARTGAAADHPVASNFPESEYLKAVWMRVM